MQGLFWIDKISYYHICGMENVLYLASLIFSALCMHFSIHSSSLYSTLRVWYGRLAMNFIRLLILFFCISLNHLHTMLSLYWVKHCRKDLYIKHYYPLVIKSKSVLPLFNASILWLIALLVKKLRSIRPEHFFGGTW